MAKFTKVIHEWARMCKMYSNTGDSMKCPMATNPICGCMLDNNGVSNREISRTEAFKVEVDIMSWAAEHPEPVYPTWYAWLKDMGLTFHDAESSWIGFTERIHHPIPADIAQKLGLKPKEGV